VCAARCRIELQRLSKKYPTLNFPAHSSDARAAPLCTAEGESLMHMLEFFLRVRVCQSLPAGRRGGAVICVRQICDFSHDD